MTPIRHVIPSFSLAMVACIAAFGPAFAADPVPAGWFVVFDGVTAAKLPKAGAPGFAAVGKPVWGSDGQRGADLHIGAAVTTAVMTWDSGVDPALADPECPGSPSALVIACKATRGSVLLVQVTDAANQTYASERVVTGDDWTDQRFDIPASLAGWQAIGAADGKIHGMGSISVGLRAGANGAMDIQVGRITALPAALDVSLTTAALGNLFVTGETPVGHVTVATTPTRLWVEDAYGNTVKELPPTASGEVALPAGFGYYIVRATAHGFRPGHGGSYGMIPDNRVSGREPHSPYGVCCHWGDYWYAPEVATLIKRVGIAWIRDGHHNDQTSGGTTYDICKSAGLCCLNITGYCPDHAQDVQKPDGSYDFADFLGREKSYAASVADEFDMFDMCNEPVFAWSKVFGAGWNDIYCKYFTAQYRQTLDVAAPKSRMFWEGYPDQFETMIASGSAKDVGGTSPHPYSFKADPEEHDLLNGGYAKEASLMQANKLSWPVWIGEMGFTTFTTESKDFKGVSELEQAAFDVRAMALHFSAGVEKICIYDMVSWSAGTWHGDPTNDDAEQEFNFGLVRNNLTPKPAIVAYANFIAQTKGCRWLGRASVQGGDVWAFAFARPNGKPAMIAWTRSGDAQLAVAAGAHATDLFGRPLATNGGTVTVSVNPIYVDVCTYHVDPVPTYALLPHVYDSTDVQFGPRYGAGGPVADLGSSAGPAAAARPVEVRPLVVRPTPVLTADAVAIWDKRLYAALTTALNHHKAPTFAYQAIRQSIRVDAADGATLACVIGIDGAFQVDWKNMTIADHWNLAESLLAFGDPFDPAGNALAGVYAFAAGKADIGQSHLRRSGPWTDRLRAAFTDPTAIGDEAAAVSSGAVASAGASAAPAGEAARSTELPVAPVPAPAVVVEPAPAAAPAAPASASAVPATFRPAHPAGDEDLENWGKTLYKRLSDRVARHQGPSFRSDTLKRDVQVDSLDGDDVGLRMGDTVITFDWKKFGAKDRWTLSEALLRDGNDPFDPAANALAGFYAAVVGKDDIATSHLERSGAQGDKVRQAFGD